MASHVLSQDKFAKVFKLIRKTFYFCKFWDSNVNREKNENHENVRDYYENAKIQLEFCNRFFDFFCKACKKIPEGELAVN